MITIYNFPRGARGLRAMWLCEEMGLPYSVENLEYPPPQSYRAKNPTGQVPFLEDGTAAMNESVAMLFYIAEKYGPTPLLPSRDQPAFARVLQTAIFGEATMGALINTQLLMHFAAPEAEKRGWVRTAMEGRFEFALVQVEAFLTEGPYVSGADFSLGDISISTSLSMWSGPLGKALSGKLADYQTRLTSRPAYVRAAKKAA